MKCLLQQKTKNKRFEIKNQSKIRKYFKSILRTQKNSNFIKNKQKNRLNGKKWVVEKFKFCHIREIKLV